MLGKMKQDVESIVVSFSFVWLVLRVPSLHTLVIVPKTFCFFNASTLAFDSVGAVVLTFFCHGCAVDAMSCAC